MTIGIVIAGVWFVAVSWYLLWQFVSGDLAPATAVYEAEATPVPVTSAASATQADTRGWTPRALPVYRGA